MNDVKFDNAAKTVTCNALTRLSVLDIKMPKEIVYSNSLSKSSIKLTPNT